MKFKTTSNEIQLFYSIITSRLNFTISRNLIIIALLIVSTTFSYSQSSCKAKLQVEKSRNSRSITSEGTQYKLELTNDNFNSANYTLKAVNINASCSNNDGSSTSGNVNLTIFFTDLDSNPITELSLNPGETKSFLAKIGLPSGTPINKWNCTQIIATSNDCSSYSVSTILHTLVSDPNQE